MKPVPALLISTRSLSHSKCATFPGFPGNPRDFLRGRGERTTQSKQRVRLDRARRRAPKRRDALHADHARSLRPPSPSTSSILLPRPIASVPESRPLSSLSPSPSVGEFFSLPTDPRAARGATKIASRLVGWILSVREREGERERTRLRTL